MGVYLQCFLFQVRPKHLIICHEDDSNLVYYLTKTINGSRGQKSALFNFLFQNPILFYVFLTENLFIFLQLCIMRSSCWPDWCDKRSTTRSTNWKSYCLTPNALDTSLRAISAKPLLFLLLRSLVPNSGDERGCVLGVDIRIRALMTEFFSNSTLFHITHVLYSSSIIIYLPPFFI